MGLTGSARRRPDRARRSVWLLSAALLAAAAGLTGAATAVAGPVARPSPTVVAGLGLGLWLAGSLVLEYHYRGQLDAFDHFEVVLALALALLPPWVVVPLTAAAKAAGQAQRRVPPVKAAFNVAQWAAASAAGALVMAYGGIRLPAAPPGLAWLALALVVVSAVNAVAMSAVLALAGGRPAGRQPVPSPLVRVTVVPAVVNISFGLLFVATYAWSPAISPLLVVPLALLHWASGGRVLGAVNEARLQVAQRATAVLAAAANEQDAIPAFLATVGQGLDREAVDLAWQTRTGWRTCHWRRDGVAATPAETALTRSLVRTAGPVRVSRRSGPEVLRAGLLAAGRQDCAAAPFGLPGGGEGVFCLYDARSPIAFPEQELPTLGALAEVLAATIGRQLADRELLQARGRLARMVTESADAMATVDPSGMIRAWNPAFERLTGWSAAEVVDQLGVDLLRPVDSAGQPVLGPGWAGRNGSLPDQVQVTLRSGQRRWLSCSYARLAASERDSARLLLTARDITDLKLAQDRLRAQTGVLELIATGAPLHQTLSSVAAELCLLRATVGGAVLLRDPGASWQLRPGLVTGLRTADLLAMDALRVAADAGWAGRAVFDGQPVAVPDVLADRRLGEALRQAATRHGVRAGWALPVTDPQSGRLAGAVAVFFGSPRPVDPADWGLLEQAAQLTAIAVARTEFENRLAHQATHDALTGLPNRVAFLDRCEHALKRSQRDAGRTVVLFLDLDGFKVVNDSMGHGAGDRLLVAVAERLQRAVRPSDTVARFGGDEFTILCEAVGDLSYVLALAERMHAALDAPFLLHGREVFVRASVGIAVGDGRTLPGDLISNADAAMYQAKSRGGNQHVLFDTQMRPPALHRLSTETELHRALSRNEFVAHYQPTVSLGTGQVTGVEALVRWAHPSRGLLTPDQFLPLAESTGLVVPISARVFRLACAEVGRWRAAHVGRRLGLSVNLSPRQLTHPALPDQVAQLVDRSELPAELVCLEITESALMDDVEGSSAALHRLKALGVRIAVDDFGTGYSSLTHLKRFPVDLIKIDRSFVANLESDPGDRAIVAALIGLAHSLGLTTVAEGVETVGQLLDLRELGCDECQGFYLWPPLPGPDLLRHDVTIRLPEERGVPQPR